MLKRITDWWKADCLTIYLRCGQTIKVDRVTEWRIKNQGNDIVELAIAQLPSARNRLLIKTVDLTQIIAVTVTR